MTGARNAAGLNVFYAPTFPLTLNSRLCVKSNHSKIHYRVSIKNAYLNQTTHYKKKTYTKRFTDITKDKYKGWTRVRHIEMHQG